MIYFNIVLLCVSRSRKWSLLLRCIQNVLCTSHFLHRCQRCTYHGFLILHDQATLGEEYNYEANHCINCLHFLLPHVFMVLLFSLALCFLFLSHRTELEVSSIEIIDFNCILKPFFFSLFFNRKTSFLVMSRCVIQSVYGERLKLCKTWLSRFSTVMSERWALFKLSMYYTYLSVISLPLFRSMFDLMKKS